MRRDLFIDTVRAYAVVGVVLGHWLVTGLVLGADGALHQAGPLTTRPALAPATWLLQTLGLFFFAGGFATTRSHSASGASLRRRLGRLPKPVGWLLGTWSAALLVAAALGTPTGTLRTIAVLAVSPLWFLLPYVVLVALHRPLRIVGGHAIAPALVIVALDPGGPVQVLAAWLIPWVLGIALADGRLRHPLIPLASGVLLMVMAIGVAGYPMSAVGVPGDGRSNLSPPTLLAVGLALAQIGIVLLLRDRLTGGLDRVTTTINRHALMIFLGHQSVLLVLVVAAARLQPSAPVPGLLTSPAGTWWPVHRALWIPVLGALLWMVVKAATRVRAPAAITDREGYDSRRFQGPAHNRGR